MRAIDFCHMFSIPIGLFQSFHPRGSAKCRWGGWKSATFNKLEAIQRWSTICHVWPWTCAHVVNGIGLQHDSRDAVAYVKRQFVTQGFSIHKSEIFVAAWIHRVNRSVGGCPSGHSGWRRTRTEFDQKFAMSSQLSNASWPCNSFVRMLRSSRGGSST